MLVLLIVVAATGGVALLALAVALLVQLRRVSTTVAALNRELTPLLTQIREDAERARGRLEDLAARHSKEAGTHAAPTGRR
jgi:hypothetical protein